jgi:hypothetical protein
MRDVAVYRGGMSKLIATAKARAIPALAHIWRQRDLR